MRIIISSAGRRVYLVEWFQQALRDANIAGDVYVLDCDPGAAAAAAADGYRQMPAITSPQYPKRLFDVVDELQPELFLSLNDHELTVLSQGLSEQLRDRGIVVPVLDATAHNVVADKLSMYQVLTAAGIATPETALVSEVAAVQRLIHRAPRVIVKDRWGSGSSGLLRLSRDEARRWVTQQYTSTDRQRKRTDELIIQPDLGGTEYGLDIVTPVRGGAVAGLLARRKLAMRHGETCSAMTVDNTAFEDVAITLNAILGVHGTIDVDAMVTDDGRVHVIDINPRFGGGYPFSHLAGADVPHFFVASTLGLVPRPGWNTYRHGFRGAKHEGIIGFDDAESRVLPQSHHEPVLRHVS